MMKVIIHQAEVTRVNKAILDPSMTLGTLVVVTRGAIRIRAPIMIIGVTLAMTLIIAISRDRILITVINTDNQVRAIMKADMIVMVTLSTKDMKDQGPDKDMNIMIHKDPDLVRNIKLLMTDNQRALIQDKVLHHLSSAHCYMLLILTLSVWGLTLHVRI